ncbi:putative disease resistance protein RGA1 [Senna tora]|uniref:Putative disease resistance protein RGA1 n=1 Tax=Senna tora TaxID=362788 RepID=A0A834T809_9FABA|nr:putative disease resistance protein RGA1 [Senna tora]
MAEAFLGILVENLNSFARAELATFCGVGGEIERLTNSLTQIQAVIEDAEKKEITSSSIRDWLQKLKDAAHVLDDILDEYSVRSTPPQYNSSIRPNNIRFRYRIGKKLKEISQRLDQIAKDMRDYDFVVREVMRERPIHEIPERPQTGFVVDQSQIYGRDGDKDKIVELLLGQDHDSLFVYPIVGLGGLGKTTLAQLVFNDPRVIKHFGALRIWVCISDDFSEIRILQSVMESITSERCDTSNLATLQKRVQEKLQNERYLLVLDDVWNQDQNKWYQLNQDKWNQLRSVLAFGSKGASVLVTTRDLDVASIMGNHPPYHLSLLSEDECWLLFKQRAFIDDKEASPQLEEIGKEIVKKCGGLPLVAKALGSLLHSKSDEKQWLEVKEIELWNLSLENFILSTLRLSYFSLTPALRRCFAFCAIFSKDEIIGKEELIHLWMANGFISSRENLEIEDVGNEIWNELYKNSFFQEVTIDDDGCTKFKMHALIHDLAQSITKKECSVIKGGDITNLPRSTHHIKYVGDGLTFNKKDITNVESLRTFFNMNHGSELDFGKFQVQSLRVLSTNSPKLPSLSYLIHLRYLAIHDLGIDTIPTSICSLRRLEILKFIHCVKLRSLPEGLANLQNLRHLIILRCSALSHMPPSIGKLSGLRTLSLFIVRSEKGHSLKELHGLKLRQRELSIKGLECVGSVDEAKGVNLIGIEELRVLSLSWDNSKEIEMKAVGVDAEQVMEALQPHSNLKKLEVRGYKGSHFPSWMKDVSNLVSLQLQDCSNCVQLPALGKLPSLETLSIVNMACVEYLDDDECYDGVEVKAFISLKTLELYGMPKLERLLKREGGEMFPHLHILYISSCPKLTLSCLPSVEELNLGYSKEELVKSISNLHGLKWLNITEELDLGYGKEELVKSISNLHGLKWLNITGGSKLPTQLPALEILDLNGCDELECIPEKVLEAINSLRTLRISKCRALKCLPEAIQHLTSLECLIIRDCPILEERCKEGSGEDWHKIQHIPNINIE